ncbi:hypothetical protein E2C01_019846 [Portunus trituberculatus]|uniref:Uncharacterized protein n=1 Tax=Portunus trituberculatus TaxID=210409 RepID=A0A5B7DZY9_PORTR|nr:hypothetical protein [Portunus trituberculatus]
MKYNEYTVLPQHAALPCDAGYVSIASYILYSSIKKFVLIAESPQTPIVPLPTRTTHLCLTPMGDL